MASPRAPTSTLLIGLLAAASAAGAFLPELYRDNRLVRAAWFGNDLTTLCLAIPLASVAVVMARRGSARALLVWLGVVAYALYNYAFYLFGAAYNSLFLFYAAILILSTMGLIRGLTSPTVPALLRAVPPAARTERAVAAFIVVVSLTLGGFWISTVAAYYWSGQLPAMVTATDHPTNVTGALDLWLVVTFGLWGGAWLWRGRPWGHVIASIWAVKGALYMTALSAASIIAYDRGASESLAELALWAPIGVGSAMASVLLLRRIG
jgi:hypothetical protein